MLAVDKYEYSEVTAYVCDLLQAEGFSRRESERATELALLKQIFGKEMTLQHNADGAPYIEGEDCFVSISHSKTKLCVAIAKQKIGVDIEELHERLEKVSARFLTEDEIECLPSDTMAHLLALALCWSAKEACYKLMGEVAGVMGDHVKIDMGELRDVVMKKTSVFHAMLGSNKVKLNAIEINDKCEIVLACRCMNKY